MNELQHHDATPCNNGDDDGEDDETDDVVETQRLVGAHEGSAS